MSLHKKISFVKSAIRMVGYALLLLIPNAVIIGASVVLLLSEIVGIIEEVWEA